MPPPSLPGELLEEIFLLLPPDEPECLVRASLASKHWLGLLTGARFRGRYRDFHGAPPMLGFLYSWPKPGQYSGSEWNYPGPHFFSTTKFGPPIPDGGDWGYYVYHAWDCRHGRVLLGHNAAPMLLVVWDPMTGSRTKLEVPQGLTTYGGAAVLCAVRGCDHRACHQGPFRVIFFGMSTDDYHYTVDLWVWVYSSETGEWSEPCPRLHPGIDAFILPVPPVVIQDALYFMHGDGEDDLIGILKYDLGSNCLSMIGAPLAWNAILDATILMALEDGSLGFAQVDGLIFYLWSMQMDPDGVMSWSQPRVIDLNNLLPIQNPDKRLRLIGSVEGSYVIFVTTDLGIYEINLKTLRWKKLWKREKFLRLIPYMSFHNPQERLSPCDAAY